MNRKIHWEVIGDTIHLYDYDGWHSITGQTYQDWVDEMIEDHGKEMKIGGTTLGKEQEKMA